MQLMQGIARKLSLPVLVVSLLGWILYIVAFAAINIGPNYKNGLTHTPNPADCPNLQAIPNISYLAIPFQRASLYWFPHWVVVIVGPFLYICSLLHLIFAKWFTAIPTNFLTVLYLVCGGAVIYTWAVELFNPSELISVARFCPPPGWLTNIQWGLWPIIEWVGATSSILFLTVYMIMRSFYCHGPKQVYYDEEGYGEEYEEQQEEEEQAEGEDKDEEPQETTVE